jgi:Fructose-2,6-bisphosphatase
MKKILLLVVVTFFLAIGASAQSLTTFILVRHAEKANDGSKDPVLTELGTGRAMALSKLLNETKVDAVYSTKTQRTEGTVTPLANAKGLKIVNYNPSKNDYLDQLLQQHKGGTVVICGHSNTIPGAANYLLGNSDLKNFDDADYDNILVVTVSEIGKGKLVWMNY